MIRQYITVLQSQPDADLLRKYQAKTGFRVFHEKNTDLYYLDSPDKENPKLPNFGNGGGYATVLKYKSIHDISFLKNFVREQIKTGKIRKYQFDQDVVRDALFLSETFQTLVLCAYFDDEDTDIVAVCNNGELEKMNFSTVSEFTNNEESRDYEAIYSSEKTLKLDVEQNNFTGHNSLFQREFYLAFGKPAPDLFFFGQSKPRTDELKSEAKLLGTSQAALRRSYGQFKLIDQEENRISPALEKFYGILEVTLKIILIPFVLIAVLVMSIKDDLKRSKGK